MKNLRDFVLMKEGLFFILGNLLEKFIFVLYFRRVWFSI